MQLGASWQGGCKQLLAQPTQHTWLVLQQVLPQAEPKQHMPFTHATWGGLWGGVQCVFDLYVHVTRWLKLVLRSSTAGQHMPMTHATWGGL